VALNRAQLIQGNSTLGAIVPGGVGVTAGTGITISATGEISINQASLTDFVRLNSAGAFNSYVWPAVAGTQNQQLTLGPANTLAWSDPFSLAFTSLGQLIAGTGAGTYVYVNPGVDGQFLEADSDSPGGIRWVNIAPGGVTSVNVTAPITNTGTATNPIIGITGATTTAAGAVQLNDTLTSTSLTQALTANAGRVLEETKVRLWDGVTGAKPYNDYTWPATAGTNGQQLRSGGAGGPLFWSDPDGIAWTAVGQLVVGSPGQTSDQVILNVGTDGQALVADSTVANYGVKWATLVNSITAVGPVEVSAPTGTVSISVNPASATDLGVVQVGTNIDVTAGGTISVKSASTTQAGVVQLYDGSDSQSTTLGATANQIFVLQQQISGLGSGLTLGGTLNAATGLTADVTAEGIAGGLANGAALPAASAANKSIFVIVTTGAASYTPPGGTAYTNVKPGDWFLSDGTQWIYLPIGPEVQQATTAIYGVVRLSGNLGGASATDVSTEAQLTAVKTVADAAVPKATATGKGHVLVGTANAVVGEIASGTNGYALVADSTTATGLRWADTVSSVSGTPNEISVTGTTGNITLSLSALAPDPASTSAYPTSVTVDNRGRVTAITAGTAPILQSIVTAKGNLISATGNNAPAILPVGADGLFLVANSGTATGLAWAAAPGGAKYVYFDDISGDFDGTETVFDLKVSGVAFPPTPATNIQVFVGGVIQTPGAANAYEVVGSVITFNGAPPTGASFVATTIAPV
jgi:hypothetical protein